MCLVVHPPRVLPATFGDPRHFLKDDSNPPPQYVGVPTNVVRSRPLSRTVNQRALEKSRSLRARRPVMTAAYCRRLEATGTGTRRSHRKSDGKIPPSGAVRPATRFHLPSPLYPD